jgi:MFS-type transporter involved in bile tolerance (Atg22 family)
MGDNAMVLVLVLCAIVTAASGALSGALMARFLPNPFLVIVWAALGMLAAVLLFRDAGGEFQRAGDNVVLYAVLLPFLAGSVIAGILTHSRRQPPAG